MIRRLSLSQRLALVVVSLLMLCAVAVCAVQLHSSAQYGNAMVQWRPPRTVGSLCRVHPPGLTMMRKRCWRG